MYREVQRARDDIAGVQERLQAAILAEDTRAMTQYGTQAQAAADGLLRALEDAENNQSAIENVGEGRVERGFVEAAAARLGKAVVDSQRIAMGTNVSEIREALIGIKTHIDYADAYLHAALGGQIE